MALFLVVGAGAAAAEVAPVTSGHWLRLLSRTLAGEGAGAIAFLPSVAVLAKLLTWAQWRLECP
jgi:hypothetical protein